MKVVTIGRSQDNDHVVIDPSVSRHHCQIVLTDDGKYMILDMGSVNGTFVNGCRITSEIPVAPSDKVRIGKVELDWTVLFEQTVSGRAQANSLSGSVKVWMIVLSVVAGLLLLACLAAIIYYGKERNRAEEEITSLTEANELYKEDIRSSIKESERQKELKGVYSDALEDARKKSESDRLAAEKDIARARMVSDSIRKELDQAQKDYKKMVKSSAENEKNLRNEMESRISELSAKKAAADAQLDGMEKELSAVKTQHQMIVDNLEEFYELLSDLSVKECRSVCDELEYVIQDGVEPKSELISRYRGGDVERIMSALRERKVKDKSVVPAKKVTKDTIEVSEVL